jgi:polysaccharide export outer membrane protein
VGIYNVTEGMMNSSKSQMLIRSALTVALLMSATVIPARPVKGQEKTSPAAAAVVGDNDPSTRTSGLNAAGSRSAVPAGPSADDDEYFKGIYSRFYESYRLGPLDAIALRVVGQPDYSFDHVVVSPVGRIYHPLLGDVYVAGLNVDQVTSKLTAALGQYIIDPKISVSLIEANSAKIGVLGEVKKPGIVVLSRPMNILDAISEAGGSTEFGKESKVTLIRPMAEGRMMKREINLKRILEAKAEPEDNLTLHAGDVIIVGENLKKKVMFLATLVGFGGFVAYLAK